MYFALGHLLSEYFDVRFVAKLSIFLKNRLVLAVKNLIFDSFVMWFEVEAGLLEQAFLECQLYNALKTIML